MALQFKVGMRFKALHNESNTKSLVEIDQWWELELLHIVIELKSIHYFACGLEIPLRTTTKSNTYMNHGIVETGTQNPLIPSWET